MLSVAQHTVGANAHKLQWIRFIFVELFQKNVFHDFRVEVFSQTYTAKMIIFLQRKLFYGLLRTPGPNEP